MIQINELIERWGNVQRVLEAMPEHDREHHWNMGVWGEQTTCGTVACAAGHCGLDPWFRERGFKMDFTENGSDISDVMGFFGLEGSARIFLNSERRQVETVIAEVREHTSNLKRLAELMDRPGLPEIGKAWPEQGGIYAGAQIGRDGGPDYFLIVGPEHESLLNWKDAREWAAGIVAEGHRDFSLPFRDEQLALFDRVRDLFKLTWYWSCEQHVSHSHHAWYLYFLNGYQDDCDKGIQGRARAVRRVFS